jgi:hypothetical protein
MIKKYLILLILYRIKTMKKNGDYYNILAKKNEVVCECRCKCEREADKEDVINETNNAEILSKFILGLVGIVVLGFVIILCVIIRSETPFYGWRRYYF